MKARANPYQAECIDALPFRQPGFDWSVFLERLRKGGFRGAIVGPHGNGKTTLVDELAERLKQMGERVARLRLNEEDRRNAARIVRQWVCASAREEILVLDGAEQLGPIAWRRFLRETALHRGLIITAHRAGRLPTLLECRSSPELLEELVHELAGETAPPKSELHLLFRKYRGNIRDCLRELYDRELQ